ncbi:hypothetical protein AVEN_85525-1 [Araneus ventricosus]|uniref:Uncharacterized protein n=1 Tax=Araneus ventricosus TaxID=182803 RepID=A0A4Y2QF74_ARAVE|nr:hypothetical protein AVEN_97945-1 [Araneus ventricosus]GBN71865.1 hypothetical protein AVEN_85525-1 [Araneus ventricosus]
MTHECRCAVCEGLAILMSRSGATRGLFWDGLRNFEPRSDDEDNTLAGSLLSKLPRLHFAILYFVNIIRHTYGLIHHRWLNHDQRLKVNLHKQAIADRNDRLDV